MHPTFALGFGLAILPLTLTPGASFSLAVSYAPQGARAVGTVIVGTALGIVTHGALAVLGLSAVVMRSAELYRAVQLAGAVYLVVLGLTLLRSTKPRPRDARAPRRLSLASGRGPLVAAYVGNVLNPKAAGVYLTIAPQFLPAHSVGVLSMSILAATHIAVMAVWLSGVGLALGAVARRATLDGVVRTIRRAGGAALVILGSRSMAATTAGGRP